MKSKEKKAEEVEVAQETETRGGYLAGHPMVRALSMSFAGTTAGVFAGRAIARGARHRIISGALALLGVWALLKIRGAAKESGALPA